MNADESPKIKGLGGILCQDPDLIHQRFRAAVWRQLKEDIDIADKILSEPISHLKSKVEGLNSIQKFAPSFYAVAFALHAGIRRRNADDTYDALHKLNTLFVRDIYDSALSIDSVLSEPWEQAIIERTRRVHQDSPIFLRPIIHSNIDQHSRALYEAMVVIEESDPFFGKHLMEYVSRIKLYIGSDIPSSSSLEYFGALFLRIPFENENLALHYIESLVFNTTLLHITAMHFLSDLFSLNRSGSVQTSSANISEDLQLLTETIATSRYLNIVRNIMENQGTSKYIKTIDHTEKNLRTLLSSCKKFKNTLSDDGKNTLGLLVG